MNRSGIDPRVALRIMSASKDLPAPKVSSDDDAQSESGESESGDIPRNSWEPDYPEQVFADESASNDKRFTKLVAESNPELVQAAKRLAALTRKP
jgi:hypothetical protein